MVLIEEPLVVCVTETHITQDIEEVELMIPGYKCISCLSHSRHTGGVIIYVKKNINSSIICNVAALEYWSLFIKLQINNQLFVVGAIYRSPNGNYEEFLNFFGQKIENEDICKNEVLIMGDFNINFNDTENYNTKKLNNMIRDSGYKQIMNHDTRITNTSSTMIDLIITNMYDLEPLPFIYPNISDHLIIGTNLNICVRNNIESICFRNFNKENINKIKIDLVGKNWQYDCTDLDILYDNFIHNISSSVNKICPVENKIAYKSKNWYNSKIKCAQKERDKAYTKYQMTKINEDWIDYKQKRNKVTEIIRQEKKIYFEKTIDMQKGDSKKMWQTIKTLVGNNKNTDLEINNVVFEDDTGHIEENFNNFYADSIERIANSIDDIPEDEDIQNEVTETTQLFEFKTISLNKLKNIIFSLNNKSTADDLLNVKLLKEIFDSVGYPLLNLINTSLKTGQIPTSLKISVIVPVPKVQNPNQASEYRPINLVFIVDKILEIVVTEQLRDYFEKNKLLCNAQSGFRQRHSCETSLQLVCANWRKEMNDGSVVLSVFVDLKRAFETIDRSRLIRKLSEYGVTRVALKWIENYLADRYHKTKIKNKTSSKISSLYGVPQGSVLGPLLFIIYVNDINYVLKNSYVNLFADDTLISVSGKNHAEITNIMNNELCILYRWLCVNKLKLNNDKTKCMVLGTKVNCHKYLSNGHVIQINSTNIDFVKQIKYLGIILDPQLTFAQHVDYLCKKIGKKIAFLRRISCDLTQWSKLIIYNTIIYPHFNYCFSLLFSCSKSDINRLQLLHNKGMRVILNCDRCTSIKDMLDQLGWISVEQSIEKAVLVLIYKIDKNLVPNYLRLFLVKRSELHNYPVRSAENYSIDLTKLSFLKKSLFIDGLRLYNALPTEIKNSANVKVFGKNVTKLYRDSRALSNK